MNPPDLDQALRDAASALQRGGRAEARALLLEVVAADENRLEAWLMLARAVDDRADQTTAYENALALDPHNAVALRGLADLRGPVKPGGDAASGPMSAAAAPPAHTSHAAPLDSVQALDDPYQCVYCGAPAPAELRRCPECGRNLMVVTGRGSMSDSLRNVIVAAILVIGLTLTGAILVSVFSAGANKFNDFVYDKYPFVSWLVGDYRTWSPGLTLAIQASQYVGALAMIMALVGLAAQMAPAYYAAAGLLVLSLPWMLICWREGYVGPVLALGTGAASLAALALLFAAQPDFQVNAVRRRCAVDPRVKGGEPLQRLGHIAKNNGEWALALAYWRAAVAAMPNQADYYKDLAIAYAQVGYYARALKALDEFARLTPNPRDFAPMRDLIVQKQARDPAPRG